MRYVSIFITSFQDAFESKSRSFVWFLTLLIGPSILMLFWGGAASGGRAIGEDWTFSLLVSYYLFVVIAQVMLTSHIEDEVARQDIKDGNLAHYLLKPFSYYTFKFLFELPYRIIQGGFGFIIIFLFSLFIGKIVITNSVSVLLLSIVIALLAFIISFTFKMLMSMSAFWIVESKGLFEAIAANVLILSGGLMPIDLYPSWLSTIASSLPFSYVVYYPIIAFEGKLSEIELLKVIVVQFVWVVILYFMYQKAWSAGIRKYTAVGR